MMTPPKFNSRKNDGTGTSCNRKLTPFPNKNRIPSIPKRCGVFLTQFEIISPSFCKLCVFIRLKQATCSSPQEYHCKQHLISSNQQWILSIPHYSLRALQTLFIDSNGEFRPSMNNIQHWCTIKNEMTKEKTIYSKEFTIASIPDRDGFIHSIYACCAICLYRPLYIRSHL